mmetsp:Transcript_8766/g.26283  ORF Transcript_8766/g.26283 Transcript_8766/m.26283 type:complete len:116 (-) Transcript_8766:676-1023(-)
MVLRHSRAATARHSNMGRPSSSSTVSSRTGEPLRLVAGRRPLMEATTDAATPKSGWRSFLLLRKHVSLQLSILRKCAAAAAAATWGNIILLQRLGAAALWYLPSSCRIPDAVIWR